MLMERFQHQRLQTIHKISSEKAFINSTNNIAIKNQGKRLHCCAKSTNDIRPPVFQRLSPLLILINVKDTCKTRREILIQWYIVHW